LIRKSRNTGKRRLPKTIFVAGTLHTHTHTHREKEGRKKESKCNGRFEK
jgi:hypothetical protein